jgi:8-oxo-dGTP diphosphatase
MKGIGLFILLLIMAGLMFPFGITYTILRLILQAVIAVFDHTGRYFYTCALAVDQLGNAVMKDLLNDLLVCKSGYKFGNPDETISSVLGKNEESNTLSRIGKILTWKLNKIDRDHTKRSIESDER